MRTDIYELTQSFNLLSKIAKIEGEGLGTSYEYIAKYKILIPLFQQAQPKNILIYGLPEKYGYSIDLILLSLIYADTVYIIDERKEKLENFNSVLRTVLANTPLPLSLDREAISIISLEQRSLENPPESRFDAVVSCEVLQRVDKAQRKQLIDKISKQGTILCFFTPNAKNKAHVEHSELATLQLQELKYCFQEDQILSSGYIDCPPNPPGISLGERKDLPPSSPRKN